jgi:hypothetical protein
MTVSKLHKVLGLTRGGIKVNKTLIRKSSKQQQLGKELREYLLKSDSEAEETVSVSSDLSA